MSVLTPSVRCGPKCNSGLYDLRGRCVWVGFTRPSNFLKLRAGIRYSVVIFYQKRTRIYCSIFDSHHFSVSSVSTSLNSRSEPSKSPARLTVFYATVCEGRLHCEARKEGPGRSYHSREVTRESGSAGNDGGGVKKTL